MNVDGAAYLHLARRYMQRRSANAMFLPIPAYSNANAAKAPNINRHRLGSGNSFTSNGRGVTKKDLIQEIEVAARQFDTTGRDFAMNDIDPFSEELGA